MKKLLFLIALTLPLSTLAQEKINGLPDDLDKTKIIFLEFEMLPVGPEIHPRSRKFFMKRNEVLDKNNKMLKEEVLNYPFTYTISKRSEYKKLLNEGYKYVLESDMLQAYNSGDGVYAGGNSKYVSSMYLLDIASGDTYNLFTIEQSHMTRYGMIISKFIKKVNRDYKK
jgi:hypothetical protein